LRVKALESASQKGEPASNLISILETLNKDVVPTEELLRATRAGLVVAKQRRHTNKEVAALATEIVTKWKKMVEDLKKKRAKAQGVSSPANNGAKPSPTPTAAPASSKSYTGDPATRKWKTDGVDIKRTGTPTRDNCVGLLYDGLAFNSEESITAIMIKAIEVERSAVNEYGADTPEYRTKIRSLFQNLKNKTNRELGPRVLSGEISADRFVVMTHEELKSAERRKEDDKLQQENMKNAQVPKAEQSISDALQCGKCKQRKVSYGQAQTRSADEPMTTFCECTICGNRWKFS